MEPPIEKTVPGNEFIFPQISFTDDVEIVLKKK